MEAATQLEETQLEDLDTAMATQLDLDVASQDSLPFLEPCLSASQSSCGNAAMLESNFPRDAPGDAAPSGRSRSLAAQAKPPSTMPAQKNHASQA